MSQSETKTMPEVIKKADAASDYIELYLENESLKAECERLKTKIQNLEAEKIGHLALIDGQDDTITELKAECERLKEISAQRLDDIMLTKKDVTTILEKLTVIKSENAALVAENEKLKQAVRDADFVLEGSMALPGQSDKILEKRENALMRFFEIVGAVLSKHDKKEII